MTDCPNGEIRDLLPDLVHDRLPADVRRKVEAHVAGCRDCEEELALLRSMRGALRRAPAVNVAAIASSIPAYRAPARRSWGGWRAAAAIVILAAGGTSVAVLQRQTPIAPASTVVAETDLGRRIADSTGEPVTEPGTPASSAPRELALGSAVVGDLDDGELSTLLNGLQTLDAIPSADVEPSATVPTVSPTGTN